MDWGYRWGFPYIHGAGNLSAKGASADQVPTADGNGSWKWADQKGSTGIDADAVNKLIDSKISELPIPSEDDVKTIAEEVLKNDTDSGVFIINLDELNTEYGTYDATKLTAWGEYYNKVKALLVSGTKFLLESSSELSNGIHNDTYELATEFVIKSNSSGYDYAIVLINGDAMLLTMNSESSAKNDERFLA